MNDPLDTKFFALSDPTRRAILLRLKEGDASVAELSEPFNMSARAVAKHIAVLEASGMVSRRKVAQRNVTSLEPDALIEIDAWLQRYRGTWSQRFEQLGKQLASRPRRAR